MIEMRNEIHGGLNRVELRLGLVEQALASMLRVAASDHDGIRALKQRIERRLEFQED